MYLALILIVVALFAHFVLVPLLDRIDAILSGKEDRHD